MNARLTDTSLLFLFYPISHDLTRVALADSSALLAGAAATSPRGPCLSLSLSLAVKVHPYVVGRRPPSAKQPCLSAQVARERAVGG